jgi:hypothetical protein
MILKIFDARRFMLDQVIVALTCPINRDCTRKEHQCDDWELFKHPDWLIRHFIENGGAEAFARRREEYYQEQEVPDEPTSMEIEFHL